MNRPFAITRDETIDKAAEFAVEVNKLQTVDTEVLKKALQRRGIAVLGTIPELEQQLLELRRIQASQAFDPIIEALFSALEENGWEMFAGRVEAHLEFHFPCGTEEDPPALLNELQHLVPYA